jgi:hypothetical protein
MLTDQQQKQISANMRTTPPSYYSADTGLTAPIPTETEAALILIPPETKRAAANYLDALLETNPVQTDYGTILTEVTDQYKKNVADALADMDPVVSNFESFKTAFQGNGQDETFITGAAPFLKSMSKGFGKVEAKRDELKFMQTLFGFSAGRYSPTVTEEVKKEWRSWKRVVVSYP